MHHSTTRPASRYSLKCSEGRDNTFRSTRRLPPPSDSARPEPAPSPLCLLPVRCSRTSAAAEKPFRCPSWDQTRERTAAASHAGAPGTVRGFPPAPPEWRSRRRDPESSGAGDRNRIDHHHPPPTPVQEHRLTAPATSAACQDET